MTDTPENPDRLLKWGLGGALFAALCCFTPLLVAQAFWLRAGKPGPAPKLWATGLAVALSILIILLEFRFAIRITIGVFAATALYAVLLNRAQKKGSLL